MLRKKSSAFETTLGPTEERNTTSESSSETNTIQCCSRNLNFA